MDNKQDIRCLIVDDEPNAHLVLENYIRRADGFVIQGHAYDVSQAQALIAEDNIDLVFLDIHMPDQCGFELVVSEKYKIPTILTSAHREHALDAFDHGMMDYLLKPFSYDRFAKAIDRYKKNNGPRKCLHEKLEMKVDGEMRSFLLGDIVYFQSWGNYVKLFTKEQVFVCSSTTREVEQSLPRDTFIRIHKSYIVHIKYIDTFDIDYVTLSNQTYLPVGITYRKLLAGII